jgi:recombination protein U
MQNVGKKFEQDFVKSVPEDVCALRMPDSAQSFYRSSALRFTNKNPFDYLLWNPNTLTLYALEMKTVKGKSISFERSKEENREIHWHQINGLKKMNSVGGCVCGFVIEFRELETTVFISIDEFEKILNGTEKKSFNYNDLINLDVDFLTIPQEIKKTHYRYDIDYFLKKTALHAVEVNK